MIRSTDERMALSRTFGHANPDTYSPREYANTISPILEQKLREGPIAVANSHLEPDNRGVSLTLVCERTFTVRPSRPGSPVNEVLHESGQPAQSNFGKFVGGLFESFECLHHVSLQDALGNFHTFQRKDVPIQEATNAEVKLGALNLSSLEEKKGVRPPQIDKDYDARKKRERDGIIRHEKDVAAERKAARKAKKGESQSGELDLSAFGEGKFKGNFGAVSGKGPKQKKGARPPKMDMDYDARKKRERDATLKHDKDVAAERKAARKARKNENQLTGDVANFLGETANFSGAASKLLKDSQIGGDAHGTGYGSYLRRTVTGKKSGHLLRHADVGIAGGAAAARRDVTALAGALR